MIEFKLPSLGADMEQGKLVEWKVKPGDPVKRGQVVAVVDTSKAAVEVEIWQDGTLFEQLVPIGEAVPVGTVIATLLAPGETPEQAALQKRAAPAPRAAPKPAAAAAATPVAAAASAAPAPASRKPVSPAARKHARELNVDVERIAGSGPHGAVTLEDVEKAAAAVHAAAVSAPADRYAEMRKAIAAAMSRSKREIPHYYLSETIPMQRAADWLAGENAKRSVTERILMGALQLKAVALALAKTPELNGFWRNGAFEPATGVHIGVAISIRQGGLIPPAIHDVDKKSLFELMRALSDLVARARAGSLRSSEMSDPTITVTNLGDTGVESVFGVIYPPQVALVGFGRMETRPWSEDGKLFTAPLVTASLSADHRASNGIRGARFLAELRERLQHPEEL
ncbi:MAG TPA: dihydrolipoamide acetyltransferase family protein [Burkholderiales bacterium]|nr:dihydrolipoamide acetyltransferase family protein [Burkholderiales bacterium]